MTPNTDYVGDTVRTTNTILAALDEAQRSSYIGTLSVERATELGFDIGESLTDGNNVEFVVVNHGKFSVIDVSHQSDATLLIGRDDFDLIIGGEGADTIYGGGGGDEITGLNGIDHIYGDVGEDALSGGAGMDTVHGGKDADVIVGGEFAPIDNPILGIESFRQYAATEGFWEIVHTEWGDGARDILSGGDGNDIILTLGTVEAHADSWGDVYYNTWISESEMQEVVNTTDLIDGSDTQFTVYAQGVTDRNGYQYGAIVTSGNLQKYAEGDRTGLYFESLVYSGIYSPSEFDPDNYPTEWIGTKHVMLADVGAVLLVLGKNDYKYVNILFGVKNLITYDPSNNANWTFMGNGQSTGADKQPGFQASSSSIAAKNGPSVSDNDEFTTSNGRDVVYGMSGNDTAYLGRYGRGNDYFDGGDDVDTAAYDGAHSALTIRFIDVDADGVSTLWEATGDDIGTDTLRSVENIVAGDGNDSISGSADDNLGRALINRVFKSVRF